MDRRSFIKKLGTGAIAATAVSTIQAPYVWPKGKTYHWRMVTTWPPDLPVLQTGAERFAKRVEEMSEGRLKIEVYAGGELVPPPLAPSMPFLREQLNAEAVLPITGQEKRLQLSGFRPFLSG